MTWKLDRSLGPGQLCPGDIVQHKRSGCLYVVDHEEFMVGKHGRHSILTIAMPVDATPRPAPFVPMAIERLEGWQLVKEAPYRGR